MTPPLMTFSVTSNAPIGGLPTVATGKSTLQGCRNSPVFCAGKPNFHQVIPFFNMYRPPWQLLFV